MNTQTQEALKMAQEVLNLYCEQLNSKFANDALKAIDEALAQPTQEPVAWNEEEFNAIAYAYRTCPAHEIKMVSDRYQELVNYVLSITHPAPSWQRCKSLGDFDKLSKSECVDYIEYLRKEIDLLRFDSWQGLSNERIRDIGDNCLEKNNGLFNWIDFARAIEQALKQKNT